MVVTAPAPVDEADFAGGPDSDSTDAAFLELANRIEGNAAPPTPDWLLPDQLVAWRAMTPQQKHANLQPLPDDGSDMD
eukprot:7742492-Alexandrium_andersonii.AAC.1